MSDFKKFKVAVDKQLAKMSKFELYRVDVDKDELWEVYLNSFPEGTNPIYKERTEHDCQCCKQFIRSAGGIVLIDETLVSMWDIDIGGHYQVVADALSNLVKQHKIKNRLLHPEANLGTDHNHQELENGDIKKWEHFHYKLPTKFVKRGADIGPILSSTQSSKDVFKRSLEEITLEAIDTVLELIEQGSLYRGDEHKSIVEKFRKFKVEYSNTDLEQKDNFCWTVSVAIGGAARVRNTSIGTLLADLSEDKELDFAVKSFESKVAPTNYKRPTALITKSMIANAQKKVAELGIEGALQRRYAVAEDITINNVLFADRAAKEAMDVFTEMAKEVPDNPSKLKKVDEVDVNTFIKDILPKATSIELMLENRHSNNLMSLIAPIDPEAKPILKWGNNFSWAYNGEVTDSIKERVKKAGGRVDGILRCSLSWYNYDDLDIHVLEPNGNEIYYGNKRSRTSGTLDVDMNAGGGHSRNPVENIIWTNKNNMGEGKYKLIIHNFSQRETTNVGFEVEIEHDGTIHTFHYTKKLGDDKQVIVAEFDFSHKDGIKFIKSLPSTQASKPVWGIATQKFHRVSMIMNSPNHWDGKKTGNKHLFFMLEGCKNDKAARGFFNEFLKEDLTEHRKVFEVLGSKTKTEPSDNQLSGLGFSSTQRNHIYCKVTGSFSRTIKINF